jgi:two-component system, LytTR family, response regulator
VEKVRSRTGVFLERLSIRQGGKIRLVECNELQCLVSRDHYTCIYADSGEYLTELSLAHLEERLNPEVFVRIHRNSIVRKDLVAMVMSGENMNVELRNGTRLAVSRRYRKTVKRIFERTFEGTVGVGVGAGPTDHIVR